MNKHFRILIILAAAIGALILAAPPTLAQSSEKSNVNFSDNLKHPLGSKQQALQRKATEAKMRGEAVGEVYQVDGEYVEAKRTKDRIWTVLGEFGTQINPTYGGTAGPLHNEIPKPDRKVNNTTIWTKDFSPEYYRKLLFSGQPGVVSMHNFYLEQSSGQYTVGGGVTDWVQLPYNAANYGSDYCGSLVCARTWLFVRDAVNGWYNAQVAAGKTVADINADLAKFDVWDRYDYNGNGNFNEPDGYIDHFQAVHAGEGQETGGGAQGTDAIWSHRWYAYYNLIGSTGPSFNKYGGIQVGSSNFWIGDYTVEPENGGVGVFSHEFAHDLGLPDLYDTSGNVGGAENSTAFWTLMSSGSYGNSGVPKDGIGTEPIHMSAYEKLYLGWSNSRSLKYGKDKNFWLSPAETQTADVQTLIVNLPDKELSSNIGTPYSGSFFYFSGSGNDLDNTMTRSVTLPGGNPQLSAKIRYDIEQDWDYLYLTVNGVNVHTNLSTPNNPNGQNAGEGITGSSGGNWVDLTADLTAYAGQTVTLGFNYWTDVAAANPGASLDDIAITGQALDDAETDPGWTYAGFIRTNGTVTNSYYNAYFVEYRTYRGYDKGLETGPYNFGFLNDPNLQDWVEHFPYQDGMLVWYYDTSFPDNSIGDHCNSGRCGGLYLPVDAHPKQLLRLDGTVWRPRMQAFDSTFGLERTPKLCLHQNSVEKCYKGLKPKAIFNDMKSYWVAPDLSTNNKGWASVIVPHTGTNIRVLQMLPDRMQIAVTFRQP